MTSVAFPICIIKLYIDQVTKSQTDNVIPLIVKQMQDNWLDIFRPMTRRGMTAKQSKRADGFLNKVKEWIEQNANVKSVEKIVDEYWSQVP